MLSLKNPENSSSLPIVVFLVKKQANDTLLHLENFQYLNMQLHDQPGWEADPLNLFQFWQNECFPFDWMQS